MKRFRSVLAAVALLAFLAGSAQTAPGGQIKDAEAATHGFEAAQYQVKGTYSFPGVKVLQLELGVLSQYSYLLISGNEALVVDPGRDVEVYVNAAKREGATIKGVWLSHSHADFVAGHIELASRLKVPVYIGAKAGAGYKPKTLKDGDTLTLGEAVLTFIDTPGHTPDGMCATVAARQNPQKPLVVFTGDTLFIGSVGRPDLLGEGMAAATLASMMYDTWTRKLSKLPDDVTVLPAHGAGSLCGAHLSDEPVSTVGQQRTSNPYLAYANRSEFVAAVLDGLPEAPQYFKHNAAINRLGPELVDWAIKALPMTKPTRDLVDPSKYYVVDVRGAKEYSAEHIPNSVNIDLRGRLETWVGILVPWDARLVLVGEEKDLSEALFRLHRVGYNRSESRAVCLTMEQWKTSGGEVRKSAMIPPQELRAMMGANDSPQVLDVRLPAEYRGLRIGTLVNIPLSELAANAVKLDRKEPVVAVCNSAYRSNMAVGILERAGFNAIGTLAGGSEAWIEAGLPVVQAAHAAAVSAGPATEVRLADPIYPSELKRLMMDRPGKFQLIDIRPAGHFADYSLPGSQNIDVAELLNNPVWLAGATPLVIVDRDGSLALMAAGVLAQKTSRPVKALHGGLAAYWSQAELRGKGAATGGGGPKPAAASPQPATGAAPQPPAASPKKKRSAGC